VRLTHPPPRCDRRADRPARAADPRARRRHGHRHPAGPPGRGRLPRRALRGLAERRAGQQRPAQHHPARDHRRHPPRVPRGRRRPDRDQHLQRHHHLAERLRHAGARLRAQRRLGPAGAPRGRRHDRPHAGQAALRRRRHRPDQPHRVHLARRERPRRPQRHLRRAGGGLPRAGQRPGRRRLGPAADRDDLRHAQRQGGDLRPGDAVRGARPPLAGHDLRHHHRRLGAHAVRAGHRGVLVLGAARAAAAGGPELRARRQGDAALHRRDLPPGGHLRLGLSQRRPAQRLRRVRRVARRDRRDRVGVRRRRLRQPRRRLLRHHAGAHRRHRARGRGHDAAHARRRAAGAAPVRARAGDRHRGDPVRQRRRAHQHHRLGPLPEPDQGRRLPGGAGRGPPAGGGRRAGHRRQHGRGDDRRRRGDGPLHQAHRRRARHLPRAHDDRLLQVGGHRGRPEDGPGQVDRQLDLPQGGRGEVRPRGPAVPQVRRGRRRHGLRRGRPGRHPRPAQADLPPRLRHPHRAGGLPGRGRHLRPERLRGRHGHRGARQLRRRLHRGHPLDQAEPARRAGVRRRLERLVLLPRQQPGARGHPRGVPLPRHRRGHGHGHRQRRRPRGLRRGAAAAARADRGRDPQPPSRQHRAAAGDRRRLRRGRLRQGGRHRGVAQPAGGGADHPRAGEGHRRLRRGRHRGAAGADQRARRAADRGHRGPAHGRHERRRRPLRRGQDVPPAGGQVRAGDEEGRGPPHPLHRGGEEARRRRAQQRQGRHGHREGRRPRHRQEHRRRRPAVQQLRRR
ncbi:MAG: 5-methyltetrahydrofolate--homocysteine methyltransferase, partial [uncultured Nocardioidaceae bacterium]